MYKKPSEKVLSILLSPPKTEHQKIYNNYCINYKIKNRRRSRSSRFIGFQAYLVFSNNDIIGPSIPTQGSPSDSELPSKHAEIGVIDYALSLKRNVKKATLYCVRWIYNKDTAIWTLADGVPCLDCFQYAINCGITRFGISFKEMNTIIKVPKSFIEDNTKFSRGRRNISIADKFRIK